MTANMGQTDRVIRGVLGIVLIGVAFFGQMTGVLSWLLPLVGVVLLVTSTVKFCPAYKILGVSTAEK